MFLPRAPRIHSPGVWLLALVLASAPAVAVASGDEHDEQATEHRDTTEHRESGGHEGDAQDSHGRAHKNEIGLFLGGTDERGHDTQFTWGLDYKRRIAERWAVGVLFDFAGGELRNAILAPSVSYWPPGVGGLQLLAAPGVEFHEGRSGESHSTAKAGGEGDKDATYFLLRLGVAYDIHLGGRFGVAPAVNLDFVNSEEVWVYGLTFTYGF